MSASREGTRGGQLADARAGQQQACPAFPETLYTPEEIAAAWKLSPDKIRRLFEDEPGVMVIQSPHIFGKRRYRTLRIPGAVAERVYHRLARKGNGRVVC